jgi:hypothetical protein
LWNPIAEVAPAQSIRGADMSIAASYCRLTCNSMHPI